MRPREPDAPGEPAAFHSLLGAEAMMSEARFDPSHAVAFDLSRGLVHVEGAPGYAVVPGDALAVLCAAAPEGARDTFARAIGNEIGRRAALRLGGADAVRGASAEAVLDHIGGEVAVAGLGSLGFERWGQALIACVDGSPLGGSGDPLLEVLLGAALATATGTAARCVAVGREGAQVRFLLTGEAGVSRVRELLAGGAGWRDAVVRLHEPSRGTL